MLIKNNNAERNFKAALKRWDHQAQDSEKKKMDEKYKKMGKFRGAMFVEYFKRGLKK